MQYIGDMNDGMISLLSKWKKLRRKRHQFKMKEISSTYNACQSLGTGDVNFQGQNQSSPSPLMKNVGLLSNGLGFRKHFLLRFFYDISLNHQHRFRGKGAEVVIFFLEKNERYQM